MSELRILMTVDAVGGVWNYALELSRILAIWGHHIHLACLGPEPSKEQLQQLKEVHGAQLHVGRFRLEWMEDCWDDVAASGRWLLELEKEIQPDLIHLNGYSHGALQWKAPVFMVGHSCVLSWWRGVHGSNAPRAWDRYRKEVRKGISKAALVAAPSKAMLNSLKADYGLKKGRVICNGCRPPFPPFLSPESLEKPSSVHQRQLSGGISESRKKGAPVAATGNEGFHPILRKKEALILGVGRIWDEAKNLSSLLQVADRLSWPIALAGDSKKPDGSQKDASLSSLHSTQTAADSGVVNPTHFGAAKSVQQAAPPEAGEKSFHRKGEARKPSTIPNSAAHLFAPPASPSHPATRFHLNPAVLGKLSSEELSTWYQRASIFAHPARYEPFGLAVLEAAQHGCALVLGDIPSLREIWGEGAVFVEPGNDEALRSALQELIDDDDKRTKLSLRAAELASRYSAFRMARHTLAAYKQLL